jgi:hypothetical protein
MKGKFLGFLIEIKNLPLNGQKDIGMNKISYVYYFGII